MADYETLKLIWWALVGVLLIGFALTDGFDMGVGALLPFLGKNDDQRRIIINTVGPHWEGNQVWFVTAGGALFAAWPLVYASAFSGMYAALIITLMALFLRPVGFDYRSKQDSERWRKNWDWALFVGSVIPPVIFGVAFGNLFLGLPFRFDELMRPSYEGNLFGLLTIFPLMSGVLSLSMLVMHGAVWLGLKTDGEVRRRANAATVKAAIFTALLFGVCGVWVASGMNGLMITDLPDTNGAINPMGKTVVVQAGAWLTNYQQWPVLMIFPLLGLVMPFATASLSLKQKEGWAFLTSCLAVASIIATAGVSLFPFVMPSSIMPNHSLTVWDATSSALTLNIMLMVACVFVPLVLGYTLWSYYKMWGRLDEEHIRTHSHSLY
ncbi:MAG: cytochrome d ubiquinol oxidase subunit II [Pseudomonadales bacterium]|nr:cytochrome d ubiquinol oxidase subunit II [Pseudomonadales bacterium]RLT96422.1 MAG: cytochrome d ubiquinol oxidase subunit II [Ketobacter sp.]